LNFGNTKIEGENMELNRNETLLILDCLDSALILKEKYLYDLKLKEELDSLEEIIVNMLTDELSKIKILKQKLIKEEVKLETKSI